MKVTDELVDSVADLAQLAISGSEVVTVRDRMARVLELVEQMDCVDTDGIEPLANPLEGTQPLRLDAVTESDNREKLMSNAPQTEDGLFLVPRVVE